MCTLLNRRMSDASDVYGASNFLLKNPAQHLYRPWIHYQINENVRLSLSPIAFWEIFVPALEAGGIRKVQPEIRVCPQLSLLNKIGRVSIEQRYRYEYRRLGKKVDAAQSEFAYSLGTEFLEDVRRNRFRYNVRAIMPLGKHHKVENNTYYASVSNELFISYGKNTNNDKIWDQNRTFVIFGYKPTMNFPMRFEMGCGLQYANRFSSNFSNGVLTETGHKLEKNRVFQIGFVFEDMNSLFKTKSKEIQK